MIPFTLDRWQEIARDWSAWMLPMAWQLVLLGVALGVLSLCLRRRSAALRYGLWSLMLVRLLLPPDFAFPTGLAWWTDWNPTATIWNEAAAESPQSATVHRHGQESQVRSADLRRTRVSTTPLPATSSKAEDAWLWPSLLFAAWGLICLSLLLRLVHGAHQAHRLIREARAPVSKHLRRELHRLVQQWRTQLEIQTEVGVMISDRCLTPMVVGLRKPTILLPLPLLGQLEPEELEAILVHELHHIKRKDVPVNLLQHVLSAFYFFHPMVWWSSRQLRKLREEACDESTIAALKGRRSAYGSGLLKVAMMSPPSVPKVVLGALFLGRHPARDRMRKILDRKATPKPGLSRPAIAFLLVLGALLVPSAPGGFAQEAKVRAVKQKQDCQCSVIRGRVMNDSGQPIANARVQVRARQLHAVRTDDTGAFQVHLSQDPKQASTEALITATAEAHGEGQFIVRALPAEASHVEVVLDRTATAPYSVSVGQGHTILLEETQDGRLRSVQRYEPRTAQNLLPRDVRIANLEEAEYIRHLPVDEHQDPRQNILHRIEEIPGAKVVQLIEVRPNEDGDPEEYIVEYITDDETGEPQEGRIRYEVITTDPNASVSDETTGYIEGQVRIRNAEAQDYDVKVEYVDRVDEDYLLQNRIALPQTMRGFEYRAIETADPEVQDAKSPTQTIRVEFEPLKIEGTLRIEGSLPRQLPEARLDLNLKEAETDKDGRYQLRGLAPGRYQLQVTPDRRSLQMKVDPELKLELKPDWNIKLDPRLDTIQFRDTDGDALPDARVRLLPSAVNIHTGALPLRYQNVELQGLPQVREVPIEVQTIERECQPLLLNVSTEVDPAKPAVQPQVLNLNVKPVNVLTKPLEFEAKPVNVLSKPVKIDLKVEPKKKSCEVKDNKVEEVA